MKKFILMGELGEKFGREHSFDVKSAAEGVKALRANFKDFESYMIKSEERGLGYRLTVNDEPILDEGELLYPVGQGGEIVITPAVFGSSGTAKIIVGAVLIAVGIVLSFTPAAAASPYIIGLGISLVAGGVIQLLSPLPKLGSPFERDEKSRPSYYFTGAVNTTAQGEPVPILYGRMIVGSAVISAGIVVEEID